MIWVVIQYLLSSFGNLRGTFEEPSLGGHGIPGLGSQSAVTGRGRRLRRSRKSSLGSLRDWITEGIHRYTLRLSKAGDDAGCRRNLLGGITDHTGGSCQFNLRSSLSCAYKLTAFNTELAFSGRLIAGGTDSHAGTGNSLSGSRLRLTEARLFTIGSTETGSSRHISLRRRRLAKTTRSRNIA